MQSWHIGEIAFATIDLGLISLATVPIFINAENAEMCSAQETNRDSRSSTRFERELIAGMSKLTSLE